MAQTTFTGPVKSINGFIGAGVGMVETLTSTAITVADHSGRILGIGSDTDGKLTLPTISAAAAGTTDENGLNSANNLGASFTFVLTADATDLDIKTDGTDKCIGKVNTVSTNATTGGVSAFVPAATNDVITLDGDGKGGKKGSVIKVTAVADNVYQVEGELIGTSTSDANVTPFADA